MSKKKLEKVVQVTLTRHYPLEQKKCVQCGKSFAGMRFQKYCSKACSNKAAYWRRPDAYREARMKSYRKKQKDQNTEKKGRTKTLRFLSDMT